MPVPSLYLDTSVLGGYFDDEWQAPTQELWRQMEAGQWRFFTSLVAAEELAQAPGRVRDLFQRSFTPENVFDLTDEMDQLAAAYLAQGVVTPKYADDARHVAACTVARHDYLVVGTSATSSTCNARRASTPSICCRAGRPSVS
jgi:hypothetical protein